MNTRSIFHKYQNARHLLIIFFSCLFLMASSAHAAIQVEPIAYHWKIYPVNVGEIPDVPDIVNIGVRVCNLSTTSTISNLSVTFSWDPNNECSSTVGSDNYCRLDRLYLEGSTASNFTVTRVKNCDQQTDSSCTNWSLPVSTTGLFWEKDDEMDELGTPQTIDPVPSYCRDVYFNVYGDMNAFITDTTYAGSMPFQVTANGTDSVSGAVSDTISDTPAGTPDWTTGDTSSAVAAYEVNVNGSYKSDYFTGPQSVTEGNVYTYQVGYTLNTHSDVHSILDFPYDLFELEHVRSEVWTSWADFSSSNGSTTNRLYISNSNTIDYDYVDDNWFRASKWTNGDGNYGNGVGDVNGLGSYMTGCNKPVCNFMIRDVPNSYRTCYNNASACNQDSGIFTRAIFTVRAKRDSTAGDSIAPAQSYHQGGSSSQWDVSSDFATLTYANIEDIKAYEVKQGAVIEWTTSTEVGTVGFDIYRMNEAKGYFEKLNKKMLPAIAGNGGGTYSFVDRDAFGGGNYTYKLIETDAAGNENTYGPYAIHVDTTNVPKNIGSDFTLEPRKLLAKSKELNKEARKARKTAKNQQKKRRRQQAAKLVVDQPGLYSIDTVELASMLGVSQRKLAQLLSKNKLSLVNKDNSIALLTDSNAQGKVYFYGTSEEGIYTDENIYWLYKSHGTQYGLNPAEYSSIALKKSVNDCLSFPDVAHAEENKWSLPAFFDNHLADYWMWEYQFAGYPGYDTLQYAINVPSPLMTGTATLQVNLKGVSQKPDTGQHHVRINLNGNSIGDVYFANQETGVADISFDASILQNGKNIIEVQGVLDAGTAYSFFYVNKFDISYNRLYHAVDNRLFFQGSDRQDVIIKGFTTSDIYVLDVTEPASPQSIAAKVYAANDSGFNVVVEAVQGDRRYLAVGMDSITLPAESYADVPSRLRSMSNSADYLILSPAELLEGASKLANYRASKGLQAMVVNIEDIMDEFNHGLSSPEAIRDFVGYAYANWANPPQYIVLLGNGTYDYKNALNHGDNLMPVRLIETEHGLFSSDTYYADIDAGDGIPEVAIGRIPVRTAAELDSYLDKLLASEALYGGGTMSKILMLADTPDMPADFPADSDAIADFIPNEYQIEKIYLSDMSLSTARSKIIDAINNGVGMINFVGHSGVSSIGQNGMLRISDTMALSNGPLSPPMTLWTCVIAKFELPGYRGIAEELLMNIDGGASAIFAASGLTESVDSLRMGKIFYETAFSMDNPTIGNVIAKTKEKYSEGPSTSSSLITIYNLLGDPAMTIIP